MNKAEFLLRRLSFNLSLSLSWENTVNYGRGQSYESTYRKVGMYSGNYTLSNNRYRATLEISDCLQVVVMNH